MGSSIDWTKISTNSILNGNNEDGVRNLSLFLKDYTIIFGGKPNAGCSKCIAEYHKKYNLKFQEMAQDCSYRLKKKYEGIPLGNGSSIMVNNRNITDAYAKILLKKHTKENIFDIFPKEVAPVKEEIATPEHYFVREKKSKTKKRR